MTELEQAQTQESWFPKRDTLYEVYQNMPALVAARQIDTKLDLMTKDEFHKILKLRDYVSFTGTRDDRHGKRKIHVYIVAQDSLITKKVPNYKKLLASLLSKREPTEILIISNNLPSNFIKKYIREERRLNPKLYIDNCTYTCFKINLLQHPIVPKHEIADPAELADFLTEHRTHKDNLPKIRHIDPPIIWLGARPGDVVKVSRDVSDAVGKSVAFRKVIKGEAVKL